MSSQFHYDSDIFYLSQIIRVIRRGVSIPIDQEFFLDKIIEDIMFVDGVLKSLYARLNQNDLLVNRQQYLRDTYLAKRDLVLLLEDLIGGSLEFSSEIKQYHSRLKQIIRSQKEDMMVIDDSLNSDSRHEEEKTIVSQEEFSILLDSDNTDD